MEKNLNGLFSQPNTSLVIKSLPRWGDLCIDLLYKESRVLFKEDPWKCYRTCRFGSPAAELEDTASVEGCGQNPYIRAKKFLVTGVLQCLWLSMGECGLCEDGELV